MLDSAPINLKLIGLRDVGHDGLINDAATDMNVALQKDQVRYRIDYSEKHRTHIHDIFGRTFMKKSSGTSSWRCVSIKTPYILLFTSLEVKNCENWVF